MTETTEQDTNASAQSNVTTVINKVNYKIAIKLSKQSQYFEWEYLMRHKLNSLELWAGSVHDKESIPSESEEAYCCILDNIHEDLIKFCMTVTTAKELWNVFKEKFAGKSVSNQVSCVKALVSLECDENIEEFIESIKLIERSLVAALGGSTEIKVDHLATIFLLSKLPKEYAGEKAVLEANKDVTMALIMEKVVKNQVNLPGRKVALKANVTLCSHQRNADSCWICHPHLKPFCNQCDQEGRKSAHKTGSKFCVFKTNKTSLQSYSMSTRNDSYPRQPWILDSGSNVSITSFKNELKDLVPSELEIDTASINHRIVTKEKGDLYLNDHKLRNVLYAPQSNGGIISVSSLANDNFVSIFFKGGSITIPRTNEVDHFLHKEKEKSILNCSQINGLYAVDYSPVCNMVSLQNWHNRLGHLNIQATKKLLISKEIPFKDDISDCKTCLEMKSTRATFQPISGSRSSRAGELLHMDLATIGEPGLNDEKYFLLIIDDYSRFSFFYALKAKSNCFSVINFLIQQIYNKTGQYPAKIRSDNGGEFIDDRLVTLCQEKGIIRQTSCAYTPMQNGIAERNIQTVTNSGNCNLKLSGFPNEYWPLAFDTANDSRNIALNAAGKSPYELWNGILPDLEMYRTFGEPGYAHILTRRSKLDAKASLLYFVGISKESKGYNMIDLNPERRFNSILVIKDVAFLKDPKTPFFPDDKNSNNKNSDDHEDITHIRKIDHAITVINPANSSDYCPELSDTAPDSSDYYPEVSDTAPTSLEEDAQTPIWEGRLRPRNQAMRAQASDDVPLTIDDIKGRHDEAQWVQAIQSELDSMKKHGVWTECTTRPPKDPVSSKWVFKIKYKEDGSIAKYKARLCARGFSQKADIDYSETFSPVIRHTSLRILLSVAAEKDLEIEQADVETAFLLPDLDEEVYMQLPSGQIVHLTKSIYGLKQAPRVWNAKIHNTLVGFGLKETPQDPCLYSGKINGEDFYLGLYVDDLILCCKDNTVIQHIKNCLNNMFTITDIGPLKYCLGYEIERDRQSKSLKMHQAAYIRRILDRGNMSDCKPSSAPMDSSLKLSKGMCPKTHDELEQMKKIPYRQIVGSLLYLSSGTRPDISFAVGHVCRFLQNPGLKHWEAVKTILRYLQGTKDYGIKLGGKHQPLRGLVDSDHAGDIDTRRSTTGYVFLLNGGPISWNSKLQSTVALSSTEAEYMALSAATQEALWLKGILESLQYKPVSESVQILGDNQGSIKLAKNPNNHQRTKHIDVRHHFIRGAISDKQICVDHIPTEINGSDLLTKPLGPLRFKSLISNIGLSA